jgi:hypothetical protein
MDGDDGNRRGRPKKRICELGPFAYAAKIRATERRLLENHQPEIVEAIGGTVDDVLNENNDTINENNETLPLVEEFELLEPIAASSFDANNDISNFDNNNTLPELNLNLTNSSNSIIVDSDYSNETVNSEPSHHSSSDNESDDSDGERVVFKTNLAAWVVKNRIKREATESLLNDVLKRHHCHASLPKTRRTLVQTPSEAVVTRVVPPGHYFHFGIENGIKIALKQTYLTIDNIDNLLLMVNMDGLSLTNSSRSEFWPILCDVVSLPGSKIFNIGTFHGTGKPDSSALYLRDFIAELVQLVTNGYLHEGKILPVRLHALVCDVPAKALITEVIGHAGYESCYKCEIRGERIDNNMCFPTTENILRTDESFRNQRTPHHHHAHSELERVPHFNMIVNVPYDYMHLIVLGSSKALLTFLFRTSHIRLPRAIIDTISLNLVGCSPFIPCEFARKPRELTYFERFKATEHRLILLYLYPILFKDFDGHADYNDTYILLMCLHTAIRILCSVNEQTQEEEITYARELLLFFIESYITIVHRKHVTGNIHALVHIVDDVRVFGSLENTSAFRFENELRHLKMLLSCSNKPLEQLVKRVQEKNNVLMIHRTPVPVDLSFINPHNDGPLLAATKNPQYCKIKIKNLYTLTISRPDNCCTLHDGTVVVIENFAHSVEDNRPVIIGRQFNTLENLFTQPRDSSDFEIYRAKDAGVQSIWNVVTIKHKNLKIHINDDWYAIMPMIHTSKP